MAFCSHCGHQLADGAKFCFECGAKVGAVIQHQGNAIQQERNQEFVGTILKCPYCGGVISKTTVLCPACGNRINGQSQIDSVQFFKQQLMEIEGSRMKGIVGAFINSSSLTDPADKKKLSLIISFPIPNTVDDILEFMLLAVANIDVSLSKKSAMNKLSKGINNSGVALPSGIKRSISDAWVSKMQQAYQKAEILFPEDQAFVSIQKLYFSKMQELKIRI